MSRRFVVTAIHGDTEVTSFGDPGPQFLHVAVSAENANGESIRFYRPLNNQPHVGDVVEFDELPESAAMTKEHP